MKFGLILLVLVIVFSVIGSLVQQGRELEFYLRTFPRMGMLMVGLGFDVLFRTWYFITTVVLLALNLTLCSIVRFGSIREAKKNALTAVENLQERQVVGEETANSLRAYFIKKRYRQHKTQDGTIFYKNMAGFYASFIVHLSFLLILLFGGGILGISQAEDYFIFPGEALILNDGTSIYLESFRVTDETGRTDYESVLRITDPGATEYIRRSISVNHPLTHRGLKYYQFLYATAGSLIATDTTTGGSDTFFLTERSFFSADGRNGIWFEILFPGHVRDELGRIQPIIFRGARIFPDPVYQILVADRGHIHPMLKLPGEQVVVGDIVFEFGGVVHYPGIRIKNMPRFFLELLYASFVLMTVGFWLLFFHSPSMVMVRSDSYALKTSKTSGSQYEIDNFLHSLKESK